MESLAEFKAKVIEYCEKKKVNGGKVAHYNCPSCKSIIMNTVPNNENETWDSTTKCYECGELHFTVKRKKGITATALS